MIKILILLLFILFTNIANAKIVIEGISCLEIVVVDNTTVVCVQPEEVLKSYLLGIADNFDFMTSIYNVLLYRQPDVVGETYWLNQLNSKAKTKQQVYDAFISSQEYKIIHG